MTVSQSELNQNQLVEEARYRRAFLLAAVSGVSAAIFGALQQVINAESLPTNLFESTMGTAVLLLVAAFLIYKRRLGVGLLLYFAASLPPILVIIAQSSGVGLSVTAGILIINLILLPQLLTNARHIVRAAISLVAAAFLLTLIDLFWPFPRAAADQGFITVTAVIFVVLLFVFGIIIIRQFPSFGLRGKLISTTLIVAVLSVLLVAVGVNTITQRALTTEVGNNLQTLAQSQALAVGELMAREINRLQALALNRTLQDGAELSNQTYTGNLAEIEADLLAIDAQWQAADEDAPLIVESLENEIASELLEFRETFPDNAEIFITDQYGALLASTNRTTDFYQADEAWWQAAYNNGQGNVHLGSPEFDESSNSTGIQIAIPMFAHDSAGSTKLVGIVRTTFTLGSLKDVLFAARFGETGQAELYLPDGRRFDVTEDGSDYSLAVIELDEASLALLNEPETVYLNLDYGEIPSLVALAPVKTLTGQSSIDALGWQVLVQQANEESLAPILQQQRFNTVMGLIVIVIAGGAAAFVGQRLTAPISRLTYVAQQVTAGNLGVRAEVESRDEIGTLAEAFNTMTTQVSESIENLEERVSARTRALETSIDLGRDIATILDREQLVAAVVNQVRDAFNYYHTHIYLLDEQNEMLVMVGGTGRAGQEMLANGHKLAVGQGLVGQSAMTNRVVLVPDVTQRQDWLPNPLLPETKAEVAVPIALGNKVLGVLDVQHNQTNSLQQEDADVLISITNQVAIALENARLLEQVRKQAEIEAQINGIGQRIQETTSVEEAMQIAIRELGHATRARTTSIRLTVNDNAANGEPSS